MNPVKKDVLREHIEELLRQNVIEECESPYAAPVVLGPKPNGKVRLFVDYNVEDALDDSPILKQADGSKPFTIRTDASNALGAVLIIGNGPDEYVIEYASRLMIPADRNYSTTEREALAILWAFQKFRGYVENQQIFLASDHQPLKWLLSIQSPSGRLARWALNIQSFNLKIDYTPGKDNVVADMLSRPSYTEGAASDVCAITVNMPCRKSSDIRKRQLEDEELKKIIDWYSPESEEEAQLLVHAHERERILQEYHDALTADHYGVENTYRKISYRYYFQGMKKFISEYIKTCPECNRYKPTNQKPAGLLRTPAYAQRFETLAIDLFGPLPETPAGKKGDLYCRRYKHQMGRTLCSC
ncbi:transposon Tf2-8 polyprotein [Trichonephila clavipes]|nr:transposon Tf2-8 polyprotein [Trichonephila clavipes]